MTGTLSTLKASALTGLLSLLIASLALSGCPAGAPSVTTLIRDLDTGVGLLAAAFPLIGSTSGMPPALAASVQTYLNVTAAGFARASDIAAGPGTDAEKTLAIVSALSGIAAPVIPSQYSSIATTISQVAQLVGKVLADLPAAAPAPAAIASATSPAAPRALRAATPGQTTKLSGAQVRDLQKIRDRALALVRH